MPQIKNITQISHSGVRPLNEDAVCINESQKVFGVFDGASSLDSYLSSEKKTGAYIASHLTADTFAQVDGDLIETALKANSIIENAQLKADIDLSGNVNRFATTAAVVRIHEDHAELLQVGDSIVLTINTAGHTEAPLGYHDHDLALMRKWKKLANEGVSHIRDKINDDVIRLRESANASYGMLNGDERVKDFLQTTTINLDDIAVILLITDGMFVPKADPDAEEDWDYYGRLYLEGGLDKMYDTVREKENTDPELITYPRYKLHDDASAIAIELSAIDN